MITGPAARDAAIQAVKDHPSTTFMAPYESLADAVLTAAEPLIRAEVLREGLNPAERAMLRYALKLAEDKMATEPDEFAAVDRAAAASLRELAGED